LADLGDSIFVSVITEVCILSKVNITHGCVEPNINMMQAEDADVCQGTISAEGPILANDLRGLSVGSHTSQLFCGTIFGLCPVPAVTPNTIQFPQPKPNKSRPPPSGKTPIQVVHVSDTHVDLSYETGASWNCTKPICCRPYTSAEAPGNNAYPAGPYGEHTCDPPLSLEQSMINAIEALHPGAASTKMK
jgi:sphingomyelin phosphodiesterase